MDYRSVDIYCDGKIHINDENLIKPQDLHKHLGETLSFHNGLGYVVTAVLEKCSAVLGDYSFDLTNDIVYYNELDMSYFYNKNDLSKYNTYSYAEGVRLAGNGGKWYDEQMSGIKYICTLTDEEKEFRNEILYGMDSDEFDDELERLRNIYENN